MKKLESLFGEFLWSTRLMMLVPVIASLIAAVAVLVLSLANTVQLIRDVITYLGLTPEQQYTEQTLLLSDIIGVVDQFLIIAILIIFADGMYELFIGKIEAAEGSAIGARLLVVRTFDDLKDRLVGVVLVMLAVKFFQQALKMTYNTPTDILLLAAGIAAIGFAMFLNKRSKAGKDSNGYPPDDEKAPEA